MRDTKNGVVQLRWWTPVAVAIFMLSIASGVGAQEVLTLDADQIARGVFIFQGWRYHGGDDPAWASPETDDSTWPVVSSAFFKPDDLPGGWQGVGWFRLRFRLDLQAAEGHLVPAVPLATMADPDYTEHQIKLESGDTILITSDGLAEIADQEDEPFGYDRIRDRFASIAGSEVEALVDTLLEDAAAHLAGQEPQDDITIVVVKARP